MPKPMRFLRRPQPSLPAWLDHFNAADLQVLFRCWAAAWVATLLIFIGPALHDLGIATFFGALMLYLVPPGGILFVYLLGSLSLLGGMCLAWAWGLLGMKAALAARPAAETQARLMALQKEADTQAQQSGQSVSGVVQELIHDGFMLDARVTIIFYVFTCVFVYVMARVRAGNPKFVLAQLFGGVIMDLFLLFGPTLPSFNALLPEILIKPGAIGIGLGAVCCLLFFPQSTSYVVLAKMEQVIRMGESPLHLMSKRLAREELDLTQLQTMKAKTVGLFKAMKPSLEFLPLDFSRGRWDADDVKSLQEPVRQAMVAQLAILDFLIARLRDQQKPNSVFSTSAQNTANEMEREKSHNQLSKIQTQESTDMMYALKAPEQGSIREQTVEALRVSTADLTQICSESISFAAKCIHTVNSRRWFRQPPQEHFDELVSQAENIQEKLHKAQEACVTETTERLIDCHADMFDEAGQLKSPELLDSRSLSGLVLGMVVEERILGSARAMESLLSHILHLLKTRTKHKIWLPSRFRYALAWLVNGRLSAPISESSAGGAEDPDEVEEQTKEAHRQLRISRGRGPRKSRSLPTRIIKRTYDWVTNPAGMYALRMVVVTIACAIPSSLPSTAGFYYREKGIWGLITAQTTLLIYMADFTFSLVSRGVGTVVGGVMGMVAWYIGSGNGPGNAYGLAAITGAMTVVLMWWRLFLPPALASAAILTGVTFVLVVGFSYDDAHTQQYGLPGRGYEAFWKRVVTVLLGFIAALIVQLFPKPPSATRHICKTLSNAVRTLSDHYALLLSHWNRSGDRSPVGIVAEQISLEVAESLQGLTGAINLLKLEVSLSPFDQAALRQTNVLCQDINQALGRLLILSTTLPLHLQQRLVRTMGVLDDHTIGTVMSVLGVIEQALKTGDPLPAHLATPLVSRCFEAWHEQHRTAELSTNLVRNEDYRRYCVAVSSYLKFLSAIDDLVLVLKGALGESHVVDRWEDQKDA